ncbi:MAG: hypothetical protein ND895_28960, partial [Pyrinomonadaceae bacterium]|nr:hypothetical protein [Pyrinomonadaceae bacterium]
DAAGDLVTTSEIRNGQTKTMSLAYDGDGKLLYESVNGTTSDYLIRSTVLGAVLTKLTATGGKDITYVPANGLVAPMQNENPGFTPFMSWVQRDALGVQERQSNTADNVKAYDPFGGLIPNTQPPLGGGPPPYVPFYGATYGGLSWNSFANANNLAAGCNVGGFPMDCSRAMIGAMGLDFAMNLGFHLDNVTAEASYTVSRTFTTKQWINDPVQERPTLKRRRHSSDPGPEWDERGLGHWLIRTWASIFTLNHEVLEPQKPSRQTYSPKDLKGTVTALASGKCATFLERLYRTVAGMNPQRAPQSKDFNILDVFNSVTSRPGAVVITPDLRSPSGRPIGGTISGTLGDSVDPATITINAITYYGTLPKAGRDFAEYSYAIRAIHESFHFAAKGGGYGDYELARAVSAITGAPVPEGDVFVKSDFWNDELERRCPEIRR